MINIVLIIIIIDKINIKSFAAGFLVLTQIKSDLNLAPVVKYGKCLLCSISSANSCKEREMAYSLVSFMITVMIL